MKGFPADATHPLPPPRHILRYRCCRCGHVDRTKPLPFLRQGDRVTFTEFEQTGDFVKVAICQACLRRGLPITTAPVA